MSIKLDLDKTMKETVTSPPTATTDVSNNGNLNLVKALIETMYACGEINSRTYEKAMLKVLREAGKND